jgi:hypothetical protein
MTSFTDTQTVHRLPAQRRILVISQRPTLAWESGWGIGPGCDETELDVVFAHSVDAGFNLAAASPSPEVIVADVSLLYGSTSGFELAKWLEEQCAGGHPHLVMVRTDDEQPQCESGRPTPA